MDSKYFRSFRDATSEAKRLSSKLNKIIKVVREGESYFIAVSDREITRKINSPCTRIVRKYYDHDPVDNLNDDYDHQEAMREINEEIMEYAESLLRSNEEGWFYEESEGDWVNNYPDPRTY